MGLLTEDFDISPLVPIDSNELGNLRMGLTDMMRYAEGHDGPFRIVVWAVYDNSINWYPRSFEVRPDDVFETVDVNYHIWETVWCPNDITNIISWFETALYNLNKDYINPYHRFVISSVRYGKYQMLFR